MVANFDNHDMNKLFENFLNLHLKNLNCNEGSFGSTNYENKTSKLNTEKKTSDMEKFEKLMKKLKKAKVQNSKKIGFH